MRYRCFRPTGPLRPPAWIALVALVFPASLLSADAAPSPEKVDRALTKLFEKSFDDLLDLDPSLAASVGDRRDFGRLTIDVDPDHRLHIRRLAQESLRRLDAVDVERASPRFRLFAEAFRQSWRSRLELAEFPHELLPLRPGWGFTSRFAESASGAGDLRFEDIEDHEAFLSRVDDLERWVDLAVGQMDRGLELGVVHPRLVVERMIWELDGQLREAETLFATPLKTVPTDMDAEERFIWARHLKDAVEDGVIPSYRRLRDYLAKTYLPRSRETISMADLPDGSRWYAALVRAYTSTEMTPEEIFELGEQEVRRIQRELEVIERRLAGVSRPSSTAARWKTVEDRFTKTERAVRRRLPELFHRVPEAELEVRQVEAFRSGKVAAAFYRRPNPDGSSHGVFYVDLGRDGFDLGTADALFLHEALPGHHFQAADVQSREDLPRFLRFGHVGAYVEGWGLYAESLGKDLGLYRSPEQMRGRLRFELGRAGRLVADVGIHHFGWSREQAERELGRRRLFWALGEIDRYVNLPGQALSYKVGELEILDLRARAEASLGDRFDVRDFHAWILDAGPLPLGVLRSKVEGALKPPSGAVPREDVVEAPEPSQR